MSDEVVSIVDERTALLRRASDAKDRKLPDESLRRLSSAALPPFHEDLRLPEQAPSGLTIWTIVPVLLLSMPWSICRPGKKNPSHCGTGVFVATADGSLVVASSQRVASEFNSLSSASWLVSSYVLAQCACQSLVSSPILTVHSTII